MFKKINAEALKEKINSNNPPLLIDVREEYEFEDGSITETNIPMGEILSQTQYLAQHNSIVLCCASGKRSKATAFHLSQKLDHCEVFTLIGGLEAYNQLK